MKELTVSETEELEVGLRQDRTARAEGRVL